jgi:hypothetical protein
MNPPGYELIDGGKGIRCLRCGRTSFHPIDVRERYCVNCNVFHDEAGVTAPQRSR